jgi:hypothetical protein
MDRRQHLPGIPTLLQDAQTLQRKRIAACEVASRRQVRRWPLLRLSRRQKRDERGELIRGDHEIDEAQAIVALRIFREFASGISPRTIARTLNTEGVAGPTEVRGMTRRSADT